jgi:hypothetical protein
MQERRAYVVIEVVTWGKGVGHAVLICTNDARGRFGVLNDYEDEWPPHSSDWVKQGRMIARWIREEASLDG